MTKKYAIVAQGTPTGTDTGQPSKSFEAYGKIHCDIFNINKFLLNNEDI